MDPRADYFGLGQAVEDVRLALPPLPACASRPGSVISVNAKGQAVCVNPEFLPADKKPVPPCAAGFVPVLDTRAVVGSGWSCVSLTPTTSAGGKTSGGSGVALVVGAAVLGVAAWLLLGRR